MAYELHQASSQTSHCLLKQVPFHHEEFAMDCPSEAVLAFSDQTRSLLRSRSAFPTT